VFLPGAAQTPAYRNCHLSLGSPTQGVPPQRDGNYDKPVFGQPQEETLMSIVWN